MTLLLDGNVLVALTVADHVHHATVVSWFVAGGQMFATTPTTQGTLLRFLIREGLDARAAAQVLAAVTHHERHTFWSDDTPYDESTLRGVIGHRQVTDAYLAARARANSGRLVTLDRGMASVHADIAELIPLAG